MRMFPIRLPRQRSTLLALACIAGLAAACATPRTPPGRPAAALDASTFPAIDAAIGQAIAGRKLPGAVFHLERDGDAYEQAYGTLSYDDATPVRRDTVFDAASLTKVLATAPAVLMLAEEGKLDLDARLVDVFPECANGGKDAITIRHLLTHSSGLPSGLPARPAWHGDAAGHVLACTSAVTQAPGTLLRYSDINYVLLGQIVQRVSGMPLEAFVRTRLYEPLGMRDTGYLPLRRGVARAVIAPTQKGPQPGTASAHTDLTPGQVLQGIVHDPTARRMDGVAGSAGVFATAHDVARFARMVLRNGELDGVRVLSPRSVQLLTTAQSPPGLALRGMGMDIDSPYAVRPRGTLYPVGSFGHTGFTGCVLWIDPGSRSFYVLLSNRVYPDDASRMLELYTALGTLAARAAGIGAAVAE
ncbi:serine hydrolase domain-containing protein [Massilia sp. YIM B02763]|uniref:serine hydrolase domain-containing protein n=1 Tax=Massilia sp. YIM B02763 TaxID=3050130 RepID=UPI0025B65C00|nr:serine hydrolase domain-containing protein [Massilia sp. YIM B02763]MDN4054785.1 serine hydrolase domain-containing protein [Massilia sp. YIM B02763]